MPKVLLVEDDPLIAKSLKISLNYQGFELIHVTTIAAARQLIQKEKLDLFILDVNLPDGFGTDLCEEIRRTNEFIPIVMLTAKTDEESVVKAITFGADDYVRKPFGVKELVVRMNRLLDRKTKFPKILSFASLKMDLNRRQVWANERELSLGRREFEILRLLIQKEGDVTSRDEILVALDEEAAIYDRTIDSHLSHLRKKIRESGATQIQINPVYGIGYRLEEK